MVEEKDTLCFLCVDLSTLNGDFYTWTIGHLNAEEIKVTPGSHCLQNQLKMDHRPKYKSQTITFTEAQQAYISGTRD